MRAQSASKSASTRSLAGRRLESSCAVRMVLTPWQLSTTQRPVWPALRRSLEVSTWDRFIEPSKIEPHSSMPRAPTMPLRTPNEASARATFVAEPPARVWKSICGDRPADEGGLSQHGP